MVNKKPSATKSAKASAPKSAVQRHRKTARPVTAVETPLNNARTEDIARLAYSLWEARGCQGGSPEEDWLRAEQELIGKR
jgi:hypothetical protein